MFLDKFRKLVFGSRAGLTLWFAVTFFIAMTLFVSGIDDLTMVFINAALSLLFGILMATKFYKENVYFVRNVQSGKYNITLKYNKMFKSGEVPESEIEKVEYLEHLGAIERNYELNRPSKKNLAILVFFFFMFLLGLLAGVGTLVCVIFVFVILFIAYSMFRARTGLQKIARIRKALDSTAV